MEAQDYIKENLRMKKIDYMVKEETGLIFNEIYVLNKIINAENNKVNLTKLKEDLGVSYSLLYKYITKIQNRKLATKVVNPDDRRRSEITMDASEAQRSEEVLLEVEMILESE